MLFPEFSMTMRGTRESSMNKLLEVLSVLLLKTLLCLSYKVKYFWFAEGSREAVYLIVIDVTFDKITASRQQTLLQAVANLDACTDESIVPANFLTLSNLSFLRHLKSVRSGFYQSN